MIASEALPRTIKAWHSIGKAKPAFRERVEFYKTLGFALLISNHASSDQREASLAVISRDAPF